MSGGTWGAPFKRSVSRRRDHHGVGALACCSRLRADATGARSPPFRRGSTGQDAQIIVQHKGCSPEAERWQIIHGVGWRVTYEPHPKRRSKALFLFSRQLAGQLIGIRGRLAAGHN